MKTIIEGSHLQALIDIHPKTKKSIPWNRKKKETELMAASHLRISRLYPDFINRSSKLLECGKFLEFKEFIKSGEKKLNRANFCRYRLCPMCSWRRSLKIFGQASQIMSEAEKQGYRFLFVTLTEKNCNSDMIGHRLNSLYDSLRRLQHQKWFKKTVKGWMRIIEITHNLDRTSKDFDTFHPHVHMIWVVKPSYFKKKEQYISQVKLTDIWQKVAKLDYKPIVHIETANTVKKGHIREVAKYSVKPADILTDDYDLTDIAVFSLDQALKNRRLLSWGGILKKIRASFKFDDPETGDLVNVDGEEDLNPEIDYIIQKYYWHVGYRQYLKSKI